MARLLSGRPAAEAAAARLKDRADRLREKGIEPVLAFIRVGEDPSDISYEKGAEKKAAAAGVRTVKYILDGNVPREELLALIDRLNEDESVHGVLLFRPLPKHLMPFEREIVNRLDVSKDVDGMTDLSAAGIYLDDPKLGYAPCTAQACLKLMDHYGIETCGRNVCLIGRSNVVGKPLALMLMGKQRNAAVTVCHTRTRDTASLARQADIIITAAGKLNSLTKDFVRPGQTVIDVSVNWDRDKPNAKGGTGAFAGDAAWNEVEPLVEAITPVPGGVGALTSLTLIEHVIAAAEKRTI